MVHNPKWLQIIFYIAVAGFPCLSAYMFYVAFGAYSKLNAVESATPFIFMGIGVTYISYIGIKLSKFISAKLEHNKQGFSVQLNGITKEYIWSDIAKIKNHNSTQILRLFNSSGSTIYVVDHMTPGYPEFANKVNEHIGI